jgi:hypothetical protein
MIKFSSFQTTFSHQPDISSLVLVNDLTHISDLLLTVKKTVSCVLLDVMNISEVCSNYARLQNKIIIYKLTHEPCHSLCSSPG